MGIFNRQTETGRTLEQLLDGTDAAAGHVIELAPGQYEVVTTKHHDHPVRLLPDNEVSVLDLIDEHRRAK